MELMFLRHLKFSGKEFYISEIPRSNEYIGCLHQESTSPASRLPRWLRTDLSEQEERTLRSFCNFNNIQIALRVGGIHKLSQRLAGCPSFKISEYAVDRNLNYTLLDDGSSVCLILDVEYC